jgi:hypothetical protein
MSTHDFIWGAENIAAFIGRSVRSTYHLLEKELIPAEKIGALWVAHRATLRRHLGAIPPDTNDEADQEPPSC